MLTKDEELRLASCIDVTRYNQELAENYNGDYSPSDLTPKAIMWLCEKLKETNDELKELKRGCTHKTVKREEDSGWITESCSICDAVISTWIRQE